MRQKHHGTVTGSTSELNLSLQIIVLADEDSGTLVQPFSGKNVVNLDGDRHLACPFKFPPGHLLSAHAEFFDLLVFCLLYCMSLMALLALIGSPNYCVPRYPPTSRYVNPFPRQISFNLLHPFCGTWPTKFILTSIRAQG